MNIKEYVYVSLLTAAAVVMGIIESSLPPFFSFAPGAKVGLANLVMIIAVFTLRWRQVWVMQILRLLITALFTGFSVFLYSFAGGILSLLAMYLMKQFGPKLVSMIGISTVGGFFHNFGQLSFDKFSYISPQFAAILHAASRYSILRHFPRQLFSRSVRVDRALLITL